MISAESVEQRRANKRLAVDEAYRTLHEYRLNRRRVVFIASDEKYQGGYGIVRKAHLHTSAYVPTWLSRSGQPQVVAVKEIKLSSMHDASDLKRAFTKEVLVWSRLKGHPGIAEFLGFCVDFDRSEAWLISPWEPYGNVSEFLSGCELEAPEKLSLAYDTIDALAFLHQLDPPVIHGDIKSANVLVNRECRAVLCDFGLARLYEDSGFRRLETTTGWKGSLRWCSPELLNGQPRTASSDIYAWAWLVWEMMTGELPYEESNVDFVIMRKIFEGPISQVNGEPRLRDCLVVWELMKKCWADDPLQRPTGAMCKMTVEDIPRSPPTSKAANSHTRSPALLVNLGDLESWRGNHNAAFAYLEQAQQLYEREGNDKGVASVLRKQAAVAYRDSNITKVRIAASAALEKCKSIQDTVGIADSLYRMAYAERYGEDGIRNLQESLKIFRAKGNSVGIAKCLERLGELYRQGNQPAKALSILEEAVDIASRCGDRLGKANALNTFGDAHCELDQLDQAIGAFQGAHDIARDIGWEPGLSTSLCRLGDIKLEWGMQAEAEVLLLASVRVARNSDAGWRLAQALRRLGDCFWKQGRSEEAISVLEESYSVYRKLALDFDPELAVTAAILAGSRSALGHKVEALAWYNTAIAEYQKGGNEYKSDVSICVAAMDAICFGSNAVCGGI